MQGIIPFLTSTISPLLIFSLFIGRGVCGGRKRKLDCFSALPGESEYEYFVRFLYDTPKSVGWKEWLTWTLELMLLFTSYTCLYVTPSRGDESKLYQHFRIPRSCPGRHDIMKCFPRVCKLVVLGVQNIPHCRCLCLNVILST